MNKIKLYHFLPPMILAKELTYGSVDFAYNGCGMTLVSFSTDFSVLICLCLNCYFLVQSDCSMSAYVCNMSPSVSKT